jgi:hypothetical protein
MARNELSTLLGKGAARPPSVFWEMGRKDNRLPRMGNRMTKYGTGVKVGKKSIYRLH